MQVQNQPQDALPFSPSIEDVARLLYQRYGDEIKYCNSVSYRFQQQSFGWYVFENHGWNHVHGQIITEKICLLKNEYGLLRLNLRTCILETESDTSVVDKIKNNIKLLTETICKLENLSVIQSVTNMCKCFFLDDTFLDKLDSDLGKMRFKNGVMDLKEFVFRPGRPEDFLCLSTGYDYVELSRDEFSVNTLHEYLNRVFPNPVIKRAYLEHCAKLLRGENDQKLAVLYGNSSSSKSTSMKLLQLTLGQYMRVLPDTSRNNVALNVHKGTRTGLVHRGRDILEIRDVDRLVDISSILPIFTMTYGGSPPIVKGLTSFAYESTFSNMPTSQTVNVFPIYEYNLTFLRDALMWTLIDVLRYLEIYKQPRPLREQKTPEAKSDDAPETKKRRRLA
jgi:hypothetical protein